MATKREGGWGNRTAHGGCIDRSALRPRVSCRHEASAPPFDDRRERVLDRFERLGAPDLGREGRPARSERVAVAVERDGAPQPRSTSAGSRGSEPLPRAVTTARHDRADMATGLMPKHGSVLRNFEAPCSPTNVESASRMATAWFL